MDHSWVWSLLFISNHIWPGGWSSELSVFLCVRLSVPLFRFIQLGRCVVSWVHLVVSNCHGYQFSDFFFFFFLFVCLFVCYPSRNLWKGYCDHFCQSVCVCLSVNLITGEQIIRYWWNMVRLFIITTKMSSSKMGYVH